MRSGHHDPAVRAQEVDREVEHWRRIETNPDSFNAAVFQTFDDRLLHLGRAKPAVIADTNGIAAGADNFGPEGTADRVRVITSQGISNDPPDIVFAEDRAVEAVRGPRS